MNKNDTNAMMLLEAMSRIDSRLFGFDSGPIYGRFTNSAAREETPAQALIEAKETIKQLEETLQRIKKEPLTLFIIERMSPDFKHAYVKKGETELRIEACKDLKIGDEVLLHPKSFQIVEHLGKPPLEASRFSPENIPNITWDDIGGLEDAKADMIEAIELPHENKELFTHYNQKGIKGILLSGPPGCGKTMLGKAAANTMARIYDKKGQRTGFLYVKGPEILNQYVGNSESTIRDIFSDARRHKQEHGYPAIVFLDEADAILAARGTRNLGIGNTIVPMFLAEMDGLEESGAIVIIATNRPDVLDPAIVRDGRIDRKVTVTRPSKENAKSILMLNLKGVPLAEGLKTEQVADEIVGILYSETVKIRPDLLFRDIINGAMLANCINIAVSFAIRRDVVSKKKSGVTLDDISDAMRRLHTQSKSVLHDLETAF